ncbi:hypothetical protein V2J09_006205 [Rumex salicifolius]
MSQQREAPHSSDILSFRVGFGISSTSMPSSPAPVAQTTRPSVFSSTDEIGTEFVSQFPSTPLESRKRKWNAIIWKRVRASPADGVVNRKFDKFKVIDSAITKVRKLVVPFLVGC